MPIRHSRPHAAATVNAGERRALRGLTGTRHDAFPDPPQHATQMPPWELHARQATSPGHAPTDVTRVPKSGA